MKPSLSPSNTSSGRLVVIRATKGWRGLNLHELWEFRELWWVLALRDLRVRYRQTLLGVVWAVAPPLATVLIFNQLFGFLLGEDRMPTASSSPYVVSTYCAIIPWQLVSRIASHGGDSLVSNRHIITKIYFPRLLLPLAPVCVAVVDLAIGTATLGALMTFHGVGVGWHLVYVPLFASHAVLVGLGVALWVSAANAVYRDVRHVMSFALQAWMYITPVFYTTESVLHAMPSWAQTLFRLNPLVGIVEGFRWAIIGAPAPQMDSIAVQLAGTFVILVPGMFFFRRMERSLTDVI